MKNTIARILNQTYFGKLFHLNKILFVVITSFFALSIFANLIRLEISPFFVWNLYAENYFPKNKYTVNVVKYNGKELTFTHTWLEARQIIISDPLANYLSVTVDHHPDFWSDYLEHHWAVKHPEFKSAVSCLINTPAQYKAFPGWFKKYLSNVKHEDIKDILVTRKKLVFGKSGDLQEIASDTMAMIP